MEKWDFEGRVTFLTEEEGGRRTPAQYGYFPEFAYPDPESSPRYLMRPIAAFRENGIPYVDGDTFDKVIIARFRTLSREHWDMIHSARLIPGARFELWEGLHRIAIGEVLRQNP